jgi:hypothetical protein
MIISVPAVTVAPGTLVIFCGGDPEAIAAGVGVGVAPPVAVGVGTAADI